MNPTVLFLFNSSEYALRPWVDDGRFNVVTVDYDDTDHSEAHRGPQGGDYWRFNIDLSLDTALADVLRALIKEGLRMPSMVISFAPCTDLAVSGARHFASKLEKDPDCQKRALSQAQLASWFQCPYAVENPVSKLATLWRKPDFYWHPWEFSGYIRHEHGEHPEFPGIIPKHDLYNKRSCLWVGNGFILPQRWNYGPPEKDANPGWEKLGGKSARTKYIRSLTPRGFAEAVYRANRELVAND